MCHFVLVIGHYRNCSVTWFVECCIARGNQFRFHLKWSMKSPFLHLKNQWSTTSEQQIHVLHRWVFFFLFHHRSNNRTISATCTNRSRINWWSLGMRKLYSLILWLFIRTKLLNSACELLILPSWYSLTNNYHRGVRQYVCDTVRGRWVLSRKTPLSFGFQIFLRVFISTVTATRTPFIVEILMCPRVSDHDDTLPSTSDIPDTWRWKSQCGRHASQTRERPKTAAKRWTER